MSDNSDTFKLNFMRDQGNDTNYLTSVKINPSYFSKCDNRVNMVQIYLYRFGGMKRSLSSISH